MPPNSMEPPPSRYEPACHTLPLHTHMDCVDYYSVFLQYILLLVRDLLSFCLYRMQGMPLKRRSTLTWIKRLTSFCSWLIMIGPQHKEACRPVTTWVISSLSSVAPLQSSLTCLWVFNPHTHRYLFFFLCKSTLIAWLLKITKYFVDTAKKS